MIYAGIINIQPPPPPPITALIYEKRVENLANKIMIFLLKVFFSQYYLQANSNFSYVNNISKCN